MWLRPIELRSYDGSTLRLRAPNSYVRLWFESNFLGSLLQEIHDLGHEVRVEFDPDGPDERPPAVVESPPALGSSPVIEVVRAEPTAPTA
ncbi:MAG TPA: DnaA N-terminal domain-containing protein, partial [Kofleriaceae bacterium]|nr:DnaA N-terminal domain-containing protein [Kofleriaceae bacterium]